MKVSRWRLPLVIGALVVLAAAIAVGIGALIAHDQKESPSPAAFASKPASPSPVGDPHSRAACQMNGELSADDLLDGEKIQAVFDEADQSKDFDIKLAGQRLYDGYKISSAEQARGGGNLELGLASYRASFQMQTTCLSLGIVERP